MTKTVPISVRVTHEDAEFIASLRISEAVTPSDKVRAIIREAKKQYERTDDYEGCLSAARNTLKSVMQDVMTLEKQSKEHSDLIALFTEWVTEAFAFVSAARYELAEGKMTLPELEEGIADRTFRLLEAVARMGVTAQAPCYNKEIMTKRFAPMSELTEMINQRLNKERGNG